MSTGMMRVTCLNITDMRFIYAINLLPYHEAPIGS